MLRRPVPAQAAWQQDGQVRALHSTMFVQLAGSLCSCTWCKLSARLSQTEQCRLCCGTDTKCGVPNPGRLLTAPSSASCSRCHLPCAAAWSDHSLFPCRKGHEDVNKQVNSNAVVCAAGNRAVQGRIRAGRRHPSGAAQVCPPALVSAALPIHFLSNVLNARSCWMSSLPIRPP